jgi:hypothetical protein
MRQNTYIEGFQERLQEACAKTGLSKAEIARQCNFDRKNFYPGQHVMMCPAYIARFCSFTGTDANWLLGVKR